MLDETILKREEKAVFALRSLYRQYGYAPYKMSKFEDYEYYIRNKDFLVSDRIITFNDTNGRLLALKPDVTLSIIKNGEDTPGCKQKVYYNENVYRVSESAGQYKEILQAGLECIGDIDTYDIFEAVFLAAQSLSLISEDFVLQVSHLGILSKALDMTCPNKAFQQQAVEYIAQKNTHDLSRLCKKYGAEDTLLMNLVAAYGNRRKVLSQLEELGCSDPSLKELSDLLDATRWADKIIFDFSLVNNRSYYNGIVFRGFLSGISESVLAGGQYDKLMQKLERRSGAIGFALYLDLLENLPTEKSGYDVDTLLIYEEDTPKTAVMLTVSRLTFEGNTVTAQKNIPPKLRYRQLLRLNEEGKLC